MRVEPCACRAVFFDVDGTLLDTVPFIVETFQHAYSQVLGHPLDPAAILAGIGTPLESVFRSYPPEQAEALLRAYLDYHWLYISSRVGVFPGIPQMLEDLMQMGIPMAIVTSRRFESVKHSLQHFQLAGYFKAVISKESTVLHKPHPEPVQEALRQVGLDDPGRAVLVGDSLHDLLSARRAGCRCAIVAWTCMPAGELEAAKPDFWLETPGQLANILAPAQDRHRNQP